MSQDVIYLISATVTVCDGLQYFFSRLPASGRCWSFTYATASRYSSGCHPLMLSIGGGCDPHGYGVLLPLAELAGQCGSAE